MIGSISLLALASVMDKSFDLSDSAAIIVPAVAIALVLVAFLTGFLPAASLRRIRTAIKLTIQNVRRWEASVQLFVDLRRNQPRASSPSRYDETVAGSGTRLVTVSSTAFLTPEMEAVPPTPLPAALMSLMMLSCETPAKNTSW